tara:strand:- start:1898 stop:2167 length:270 start_codon:yes stop_codon:yes gene_type:complete
MKHDWLQPEWYSFNKWIDTFVEEKNLDINFTFEIEKNEELHLIELSNVISYIKAVDLKTKNKIKSTFVKIDFLNGDVLHFFKYLARGIV